MATSKKRPEKKKNASPSEPEKDKLTLKYWLIGFLVVAIVTGALILIANLAAHTEAIPFTLHEGSLTRDTDGTIYLKADGMYRVEAYTKKSEPRYGKAGNTSIYKVGYKNEYGVVVAMDEDRYLTDGKGTLYYSSAVSLPTLASFDTEEVSMGMIVTTEKGTTVTYLKTLTNESSPDADDFVTQYLKHEFYDGEGNAQETCELKLTSSKYPYLSYIMNLVRCDNGDFYVYTDKDRSSICVDASWFESVWATPDTDTPETTETPVTTEVPQVDQTP